VPRNNDLRVERPEPNQAVVVLEGEHDLSTAGELRDLLARLVTDNRVVVVDLSAARFADSMTLNVLVRAKAAADDADCRLRVQMGPDALLHRLFEVAGLIEAMDVVATRADALDDREGSAAA
jgi:anti-anti-sigma factor